MYVMDHDHHHGSSDSELAIDRQLNAVVVANLFDAQPPCLSSFFRFQLGSNTFDGLSLSLTNSHTLSLSLSSLPPSLYECACACVCVYSLYSNTPVYLWAG